MATEGTCATCRWWWGGLAGPTEALAWGVCGAVPSAEVGVVMNEKVLAVVVIGRGDDDAYAYLETRDGFGCNRWQAKDGE